MNEPPYYPYPDEPERIDPFDVTEPETQSIYIGGTQLSYAYLWPRVVDAEQQGRKVVLQQAIPMGYKILRDAQKIAVALDGAVVREWPITAASFTNGYASADPIVPGQRSEPDDSWLRGVCGYTVFTSGVRTFPVPDAYDRDGAFAALREASRTAGQAVLLFVHGAVDWH
jgi:hypothetical protein